MKKKTLMAFTLSLFMSCLVMVSGMNTASASGATIWERERQFLTISEMANALEGDYEIVWAGIIWDAAGNNWNGRKVDMFSKDVGAVVRIEMFVDSYEQRNLVGYIIKDVPGSANHAVESISNYDEWYAGWEDTVPIIRFSGSVVGPESEEIGKDLPYLVEIRSKNGAGSYSYDTVGTNVMPEYELVGNQLNLFYQDYNKKTRHYDRIYFLKLRRIG